MGFGVSSLSVGNELDRRSRSTSNEERAVEIACLGVCERFIIDPPNLSRGLSGGLCGLLEYIEDLSSRIPSVKTLPYVLGTWELPNCELDVWRLCRLDCCCDPDFLLRSEKEQSRNALDGLGSSGSFILVSHDRSEPERR